MAKFQSWESDPFHSAAEVVQDSADRMEAIFRMLLHDQSLLLGDPSDPKLLASIDYHKRDLATALGTTKWQLEDFERAINFSSVSVRSQMREGTFLRHKQFIRAIREQIIVVEKSLGQPTSRGADQNAQWVSLNQQDRDGLALFLSGNDPTEHQAHYDSDASIMRRFLDSTSASGFDKKNDEIIELKTEDSEPSMMNGVNNVVQNFDSLNENKLRKVASHSLIRSSFDSSIALQGSHGLKECEVPLVRSSNSVDALAFLRTLWPISSRKMSRSFVKRRKDGEVADGHIFDIESSSSASTLASPSFEQVNRAWLSLTSRFSVCQRVVMISSYFDCFGPLHRVLSRFQYYIPYGRLPLILTYGVLCTLALLGTLAFYAA